MNKKNIIGQPVRSRYQSGTQVPTFELVSKLLRSGMSLRSGLMLVLIFIPVYTQAQGNAAPARQSPAGTMAPSARTAFNSGTLPPPPNSVSFPESPVAFDPNVRPADLSVSLDELPSSYGNTNDSTANSTTNLITTAKAGMLETTSSWLSRLNQDGGWRDSFESVFGASDIGRMLGSLALVLGGYFSFIWLVKKFNPAGSSGIPSEVIEVLGCVPYGPRKNLELVRLGSKLLLLMTDAEGTRPIGEISDSSEVDYLTSLCQGKRKALRQSTRTSADLLKQVRSDPAPTVRPSAPAAETIANLNTNLAQVLRSLENATRPGTSFEA